MKGLVHRLGLGSPFRLRFIGDEACIEIRSTKMETRVSKN
jgi:hypothetical protein